ncbi:MAG: macro domain-containing protein [Sulfurimonas sp.]
MSYHVIVKQGNLLSEQDAAFIVNASNTRLILGSGVSMAFLRHCGKELQEEMTYQLAKIGEPLKQGDVVATSPGHATNFKYALHAAIMDYNPGTRGNDKFPTLDVIQKSLENIEAYLEWYAEKNSQSMKLVLPLMGCGAGGLDKRDVVELYKKFFWREVGFSCEVALYGYTQEDHQLIESVLSRS